MNKPKKIGPLALALALDALETRATAAFARFEASGGADQRARAEADRAAAAMQSLILEAVS